MYSKYSSKYLYVTMPDGMVTLLDGRVTLPEWQG